MTAALCALAMAPAAASATDIDVRTLRASSFGTPESNGPSANPSLSAGGRFVAFDTAATSLPGTERNGPVRDIVYVDAVNRSYFLISQSADGLGANGNSTRPVLAGAGNRVAFRSEATNLGPADGNTFPDVYVAFSDQPVRLISAGPGGEPANGASGPPDISGDGRFVAFSSAASNLVPNDTNGKADVFLADLATGAVRRVSVGPSGLQANGDSVAPAVSTFGRFITFESAANNLVGGDTNNRRDVFRHDVTSGRTERVSVNSREQQQNDAVIAPFAQISDITADGRYVVFESDATNLVPGDTNRDTDVFLRDMDAGSTTRVSEGFGGRQGDNDSFAPSITPDGRYIAFESFAEHLAPGDAKGEDVFIYDRVLRASSVANVSASGQPREAEKVEQLLQRPVMSADALVVAFSSTAGNLVAGDANGVQDIFLRAMNPPTGSLRVKPKKLEFSNVPRYSFRADDTAADNFLCRIDGGKPFDCGKSGRLPKLRDGRHVLRARAGGAGMLYSEREFRHAFRVKTTEE